MREINEVVQEKMRQYAMALVEAWRAYDTAHNTYLDMACGVQAKKFLPFRGV